MQLVDVLPFTAAVCDVCGGTDLPWIVTPSQGLTGRIFLCRWCVQRLTRAVEVVPLIDHVALAAELDAAKARDVEAEQQAKAAFATERELRQQVATLQDDVATAGAKYAILKEVNAELKADKTLLPRQEFLGSIANPKPAKKSATSKAQR